VHRLAETSDTFLRTRLPPRNPGLNGKGHSRRANVECISQTITGQIVISSGVAPDRDDFIAAAEAAGLPAMDHPEMNRASIALLQDARLSGIDFKLFDPRELHPGADRLSFVFLETGTAPFLDGRLVQVDRGEACRRHDAELIRGASFYLGAPSIELHSYLEDWSDLLLSWVKHFFIEDLSWRRWEEMQGYDDYRDVFLDVETALGKTRAEQATFDAILATFAQHAEHWSQEVAAGAEA
jgi:hypothetical protein